MTVRFLPPDHAIHRTSEGTQAALREAQDSTLTAQFADAHGFMEQVLDDLKSAIHPPEAMKGKPPADVADLPMAGLVDLWRGLYLGAGSPPDAAGNLAAAAAERSQLLRAYRHPEVMLRWVKEKVEEQVAKMPKGAADLRQGRNKGDVLDPYILAATQLLLFGGDRDAAVNAAMAHKALMVLEGMLGHLHEEVTGKMRGNVRVPEPRKRKRAASGAGEDAGEDAEGVRDAGKLDLVTNPFAGADAVQPPLFQGDRLSFHQIKSKTGSMNSSGGRALGLQMKGLADTYEGSLLYSHSLVGPTLSGHRSMKAIENVEPRVVCTVGDAAFRVLTRAGNGAELLLRVYVAAFREVSGGPGRLIPGTARYDLTQATAAAVAEFEQEARAAGEGFLETLLHNATRGPDDQQSSPAFNENRRIEEARKAEEKKTKEKRRTSRQVRSRKPPAHLSCSRRRREFAAASEVPPANLRPTPRRKEPRPLGQARI